MISHIDGIGLTMPHRDRGTKKGAEVEQGGALSQIAY